MAKGGLSAKQKRAIGALLTSPTVDEAAKIVGVDQSTMHRWLNDARFCKELQAAQSRALSASIRALQSLVSVSVGVLAEAMKRGDAPSQQLRAAEIVQSKLPGLQAISDVEARLTALEAAITHR